MSLNTLMALEAERGVLAAKNLHFQIMEHAKRNLDIPEVRKMVSLVKLE
jgi:hypothetical protein